MSTCFVEIQQLIPINIISPPWPLNCTQLESHLQTAQRPFAWLGSKPTPCPQLCGAFRRIVASSHRIMITGKGAAAAVVWCSLTVSEGCDQAAIAAFQHVPGGALVLTIWLANSHPSLYFRSSEKNLFIHYFYYQRVELYLNSSQKMQQHALNLH